MKKLREMMKKLKEGVWPDLPADLVLLLINDLSYPDMLSIRNAIPKWRPYIPPTGVCHISFQNNNKTCTINDPLHHAKRIITTPDLPSNMTILASGHGWLLLMDNDLRPELAAYNIFFYNPLTNVVIKLPPFGHTSYCKFSFSSPPDMPGCIIVASLIRYMVKKLVICQKGDTDWTELLSYEHVRNPDELIVHTSAIFHGNRFYWVGIDGRVGELDPSSKSWQVYGSKITSSELSDFRSYIVKSSDDICWVQCYNKDNGNDVHIWKLDLNHAEGDIWYPVNSTEGSCFFLGLEGSFAENSSKRKGDRIYFPVLDGKCVEDDDSLAYYSYEKGVIMNIPWGKIDVFGESLIPSCWI